jgi:hypothetical protein
MATGGLSNGMKCASKSCPVPQLRNSIESQIADRTAYISGRLLQTPFFGAPTARLVFSYCRHPNGASARDNSRKQQPPKTVYQCASSKHATEGAESVVRQQTARNVD